MVPVDVLLSYDSWSDKVFGKWEHDGRACCSPHQEEYKVLLQSIHKHACVGWEIVRHLIVCSTGAGQEVWPGFGRLLDDIQRQLTEVGALVPPHRFRFGCAETYCVS